MVKEAVVDAEVAEILDILEIGDDLIKMPQMTPKLYKRVNHILSLAGAKWVSKRGGHVFTSPDVIEKIREIADSGRYIDPRLSGYFPTPEDVALELLSYLPVNRDMKVLEPSAGRGAIADQLLQWLDADQIDVCELLPENAAVLQKKGYRFLGHDFLALEPDPTYDVIAMNPPFGNSVEIDHVMHALRFLGDECCLGAIMPRSVEFGSTKKQAAFREILERWGHTMRLPDKSFHEVGTDIQTNMVFITMDKDLRDYLEPRVRIRLLANPGQLSLV